MAKYKAYPEYKDSGVEWLGEIPLNWRNLPHKYLAVYYKGRNPRSLSSEPKRDCVPYLSMSYLRTNIVENYTLITSDVRVVPDDLILIIWDGSNAGEFIKSKSGILSSTMAVANVTSKLNHQYYWFSCNCIEPEIRRHATGMGIPHVNGDHLRYIAMPRPSIEEQIKISLFLIHETMKIDLLVEKQQQLIELLKEKRQAVISHAVTKGLNPDAPMKDSGVEWLGQIPEHWNLMQTNRLYKRIKRTGRADEELLSVYRDHGVIPKSSRDDNNNKPSDDLSQYQLVKIDDLVLNKMKAWQGSIAISKFKGIVSPAYFVYKPQNLINRLVYSQYIHHLLRNSLYITQYLCRSKGIRINQWDLDPEEFKTIPVLLPPKAEQKEIYETIDYETAKIDTLIQKQLQQIDLLKERRTALISAAVTGKIDLRNWTPPASSAEAVLTAEEATA
ncbi:restriction endonuclease subunit S [Enterobacter asburiae]|jgi:type I restriction enzyme S subunit|uniref:restriction endonuclease subunit S n=1 Tax=Enterobacter asburiae TaxID=61645 RepID=UPI0018E99504|nr:restriction endonuclease subunit S [Enterobacter asburiae]MBJ3782054.1 restriction endonuclease subunit S [Enterobacter asburiae]